MVSRDQRGFTLDEVLVTLLIVALLTVVAGPKLRTGVDQARLAKAEHELTLITQGLERHYLELGYYPIKLDDLVERGYLKPGITFRSPTAGHFYFYAIDDNSASGKAKAYALGNPAKTSPNNRHLHRAGNLPRGRTSNQRAWAWYVFTAGTGLTLYQEDDQTILPDPLTPQTLTGYRFACHANSAARCDLVTN